MIPNNYLVNVSCTFTTAYTLEMLNSICYAKKLSLNLITKSESGIECSLLESTSLVTKTDLLQSKTFIVQSYAVLSNLKFFTFSISEWKIVWASNFCSDMSIAVVLLMYVPEQRFIEEEIEHEKLVSLVVSHLQKHSGLELS